MAPVVLQWALLVLLAPVLLVLPGYLTLQLLAPERGSPRGTVSGWETLGLSVALSLAWIVLVAFALSQTLGLSRVTLVAAHLLLLVGLGALAASSGRWPLEQEAGPGQSFSTYGPGRLSAWMLGATLILVLAGVGLFDGSQPYSEAYYANGSEVPQAMQAPAGSEVAWTVVVENHEQATTTYRLETRLIPNSTENETHSSGTIVDTGELVLQDEETATREIGFQAPDCCVWKAKTLVYVEGAEEPLTVHRWLHVGTA